jgi:hypothetical protein
LHLRRGGGAVAFVEIRTGSTDPEAGELVGSATLRLVRVQPGRWTNVRFVPPVSVEAGRGYGVVVKTTGPTSTLTVDLSGADRYADGAAWEWDDGTWRRLSGDLAFRLSFEVPP